MNQKQKVTAVVLAVMAILILWQVISMFSGSSSGSDEKASSSTPAMANNNGLKAGKKLGPNAPQGPVGPEPTQLPNTNQVPTAQQVAYVRMQQEVQARYVSGINELQLLRLAKDIVDTNKDIATSKLALINAEKEIVDKLSKPAPMVENQASYGQNMGGQATVAAAAMANVQMQQNVEQAMTNYLVISVSELMSKWSAVLGSQGKLFNVSVGDTLPPDGSTVKAIDRSGVVLERDGTTRKISLVPII